MTSEQTKHSITGETQASFDPPLMAVIVWKQPLPLTLRKLDSDIWRTLLKLVSKDWERAQSVHT